MIPQNELRIGNYVSIPDRNDPATVEQIMKHEITVNEFGRFFNLKHIDPIPITEDWLIRLGFKKGDPTPHAIGYFIDRFGIHYHFKECNWYSWTANIKYVHQLQNLYFAITGKELELKQNE